MDKLFIPPNGTRIDSFHFDEVAQTITVIKRLPSNQVYASNPPQSAPDKVWKEIYGIKDGKLTMFKTMEGKHIPKTIKHEQLIFEEETE